MPTDDTMATVLGGDGPTGLRFRRHLAHPPEKVWRALTESDQLRHWFPCDLVGDRRAGSRLELPFWPDHVERHEIAEPVVRGEIRTWDPPRVFEWTWDTDLLRWELEAVEGGTLLTLTTWVAGDDPAGAAGAAAGYHVCLEALRALLDTGTADPLVDTDTAALRERYAAIVGAAVGSG